MGWRGFGFESLRVLELRDRNFVIPEESRFIVHWILYTLSDDKALLFLRCQGEFLEDYLKQSQLLRKLILEF